MTDRNVRQISPPVEGNEEQSLRPFSAFADQGNIVLLGDPGAGKTHLFEESAQAEGGRFLKARAFLNIPSFPSNSVLYIDGLDERRAGRGDQGTIDEIVQKLFAVSPAKVRLSCRVVDWLGEADLAAFQPYFDLGGGAVVLGLERLSPAEQRGVLAAKETNAADADAFIHEAQTRGLQEYLDNPQSLIMLLEAVRSGSWPETRKELFELSTRLLLSESNREHARANTYSADELRGTVGAICAARLISDVAGISLTEHGAIHAACPSVVMSKSRAKAVSGVKLVTAELSELQGTRTPRPPELHRSARTEITKMESATAWVGLLGDVSF